MQEDRVAEEEGEEDGRPCSSDEEVIKVVVGEYVFIHYTIEL